MNKRGNEHLTGLWTREELEEFLKKIAPTKDKKTMVLWDIEHFKDYNLEHGYYAGDEILIEIANMISNQMRKSDIVVRYDGDIFLCILNAERKKVEDRLREVHEYIEAESELELTFAIYEVEQESKEGYQEGIVQLKKDLEKQKELLSQREAL